MDSGAPMGAAGEDAAQGLDSGLKNAHELHIAAQSIENLVNLPFND